MNIGEVIVELRKQKGVKQKELAQQIKISASYLSQVEHGAEKPSIDLIAKIANYFNLPATSIFYMALDLDSLENKEQKKYFKAAKPMIDKLINYLLTDTTKGKDPMAKIKTKLKKKKSA